MTDSTHDADRIMAEGRRSLVAQRAGGRRVVPIGQGSRRLRAEHRRRKLRNIAIAVVAILAAATVAGLMLGGIGFTGIVAVVFALIATGVLLGRYPTLKVPTRANLAQGSLRENVARTELWLETQRPALPAPAVALVDQIGVQLDGLGVQLDGLDANTHAAMSVRDLVTRDLPEVVGSYTRIPRHLRSEGSAGSTPDAQLAASLGRISREIDTATRQLAEGALDELAVRSRYLDYKYGAAMEQAPALPPQSAPDPQIPSSPPMATVPLTADENSHKEP